MRVLVAFALEDEFAPWRMVRDFCRVEGADYEAFEATLGDADTRVMLTGAGSELARRAVRQALSWVPEVFIASGFAGSLHAALPPGTIFAAAEVRNERNGQALRADAALLQAAVASGARRVNTLLTSERVILTKEEKRQLSEKAGAVDMESATGLSEAAARGITGIAIRAVSDAADEDLPLDFNRTLDKQGRVRVSSVIGQLAKAPHRLPALVRLGRDSHRAAKCLAEFLDAYVREIASKKEEHAQPVFETLAK